MISLTIGQIALAIYAALLINGGLLGYVKAGSRPSLIAGIASGLAAILALVLSFSYPSRGMALGAVLAVTMGIFFGYRYAVKTHKFMPAGMLAVLSLIALGLLIGTLV